MRMSGGELMIGCVLWALVGFSIGRYRGIQAARAAYIMANSAFEESERQAQEVEACAHRISGLDQQIREVRLCRDQAEAEAAEARARVLLAWAEADQLEAMLNTAEDDLDAARRDRRQAEELAEELAEGTERQLAEEVIAARFSGWLVEDQSRRYEARIARRASLSASRRAAPSAVHGPDPGGCDDAAEKKS